MKKKKIRKAILMVLFVAVLLGTLAIRWYTAPIPQYTITTLCSKDGDRIRMVMDLTWHRHLLSPTDVEGSITINGIVYNYVPMNYADNFFDKIKRKLAGNFSSYFAVSSDSGLYWFQKDHIELLQTGKNPWSDNLSKIALVMNPQGGHTGTFYFGPADTTDEVDRIIAKYVDR
ncbi:MAG: hypothetical protein K2N63_10565 [Lachnospiraceae bacterium]|nr:hypothetical protein [Lachnospiraceae bacterium]